MKRRIAVVCAMALLGWIGAGYAQPPAAKDAAGPGTLLKRADVNNDGKVTFDELKAVNPNITQEQFKARDRNGDGVLTAEDRQGPNKPVPEGVEAADADGDGKVTFDELKAKRPHVTRELFDQMDRNKDGVLTKDDRTLVPPAQPRMSPEEVFKKADANNDGRVTFEELKAVRPQLNQDRFNMLDTDKDGVLTPDEIPAPVSSQPSDDPFLKADADKDGRVTFNELKALLPNLTQAQFDQMDKNRDGALTRDEMSTPGQQAAMKKQAFFEKLMKSDANGDGKVTLEEARKTFPKMSEDRFKELDINKDGVIGPEDKQP